MGYTVNKQKIFMKSIIIISKDKEKSDKYMSDLCNKEKIGKFDMYSITGDSSIGIGEVRKIKETIFLAPGTNNKKAVVIKNANLLTAEAQSALLKTLEEPPDSTFIILISDSTETFLATIISRCEIINLLDNKLKKTNKENEKTLVNLNKLTSAGINARLKMAQDNGKTKDSALRFLEEVIKELEIKLIKHKEINLAKKILPEGQKIYTDLKTTNINPRLTLEYFLLKL